MTRCLLKHRWTALCSCALSRFNMSSQDPWHRWRWTEWLFWTISLHWICMKYWGWSRGSPDLGHISGPWTVELGILITRWLPPSPTLTSVKPWCILIVILWQMKSVATEVAGASGPGQQELAKLWGKPLPLLSLLLGRIVEGIKQTSGEIRHHAQIHSGEVWHHTQRCWLPNSSKDPMRRPPKLPNRELTYLDYVKMHREEMKCSKHNIMDNTWLAQ